MAVNFSPYGIKIAKTKKVSNEAYIALSNLGQLFIYTTRYKFRELRETNIPVATFKKIPSNITTIIIVFEDKPYLIKKKDIPKKPRIIKNLAIYPIPFDLLTPLEPKRTKWSAPFVHLHVHSDYSLVDGLSMCRTYLEKAKKLGMPALAITDHGNMSSHMDLQIRAKEIGIKPIFGTEMYIVENAKLHDGDHRTSNHIILLAKNKIGYKNLLALQKLSWSEENFYYRPRIDFDMLAKHRRGLVVLTACLKGLLAKELLRGDAKVAYKKVKWLKKLFVDDLYLEIQLHKIIDDGKDIQKVYNKKLIRIAKKLDIKVVVTNDVHYAEKGMHKLQSKVVRMKTDSDLADAYCSSIWFKDYKDIKIAWKKDKYIPKRILDESVKSTIEIANKCNFEIPTGGLRIPTIDLAEFPGYKSGWTEEQYVRYRIKIGLVKKAKKLSASKDIYDKRIKYELDAFAKMNVFSYILIYDDLIRFLKKKGCLCSLRGSANGSVILWLMELSIVDPIKYNILFERFISPARIQTRMADIDIDLDIAHTYRDMAIDYLKEKYGEDHICSVGSFGRTQLKAAVKNLARVEAFEIKARMEGASENKIATLERKLSPFSYREINKITKAMPNSIDELEGSTVATWFEENRNWFEKYVRPIIGNAYAESLHPAGIVISPEPYHHWLPVRTNKLSKEKGGHRVFATQWENSHTFEEYLNERGVMVMDVLGVKTLTIISDTIKLIKKRHDKKLSLDSLPVTDKKVYESLSEGENLGFFQLGKKSLKNLFISVKPDKLEDIIFMVSADRPGPLASGAFEQFASRKHGKSSIKYPHHSLRKVLKDTLGVLTYSEHIMGTATEFAGLDPADSEQMRKIIKAKSRQQFLKFRRKFIEGAVAKWAEEGNIQEISERVWDDMMGFSQYAFPKAHATAYALIANATQYLKIHYPIEFFCAFLQQAADDEYLAIKGVSEDKYKTKYIMPEINLSKDIFVIHQNKITWSLTSIKGIGHKAANEIVKSQPYKNFDDFFNRVNKRVVNIRVVKALITANVFRKFGIRNEISKQYKVLRKDKAYERHGKTEWNRLASEIMPYALESVKKMFPNKMGGVITTQKFYDADDGDRVVIAGTIEAMRTVNSRYGNMIIMRVFDIGELYNIVCWNAMYKRLEADDISLKVGMPVKISGYKGLSNMGEPQIQLGHENGAYIKCLT
jgi:DNA polymerase III subunit alpha